MRQVRHGRATTKHAVNAEAKALTRQAGPPLARSGTTAVARL